MKIDIYPAIDSIKELRSELLKVLEFARIIDPLFHKDGEKVSTSFQLDKH
jgi:hypothetical protein